MWSKNALAMLLSLTLMWGITACQKSDLVEPFDASLEEELSLDKPYGGFDTSDELPGFGDSSIISEFSTDDESVSDPVSMVAATDVAASSIPAYFVRITWGKLEGDSSATDETVWNGYAEINRGTLAVLKVIRFERATDRLVLPRESRQKVAFESVTSRHFDGLLLLIIDNDTTDVEGTLTFVAGNYTKTLSFSELDSLNIIEPVDNLGNEVSIVSRSRQVDQFDGGFFTGHWIRRNGRHGYFEGRWIDVMGNNAGFLRGIWGQRGNGQRVLFGKYIKGNGRFGGLLRGEWGYSANDTNHGWLHGTWVSRNFEEMGRFRGVWKTGRGNKARGFFHGRWNRINPSQEPNEG